MTRLFTLTAAGLAALAMAACDRQPVDTETAAAFPGADAIPDEPAPAPGAAPPAGTSPTGTAPGTMAPEEGAPPYPTPTLPPEEQPGSPASGAASPPER